MPYIRKERRVEIKEDGSHPATAGELNYLITLVCQDYLVGCPESYAMYNEVIGVLESVKLEFYRRQVAAYEDRKREENGDVY